MRVVLIGMMASGKTTIGRIVAESLGWPYVDNDEELIARTGRGPRDIEEQDGIDALHALEATLLLEALAKERPAVVAAAASTVENPACREALHREELTVWVATPPAQIARKVAASTQRPLTDRDIEALAVARADGYQELADLTVDTAALGPEGAAAHIVAAARQRFAL